MKLSCFSAVIPLRGWNQWVKWVAPCSTAQSFMALATALATPRSRSLPSSMVLRRDLYTSRGKRSCITSSLNTRLPKSSGTDFRFSQQVPIVPLFSFGFPACFSTKQKRRRRHTPPAPLLVWGHYKRGAAHCQGGGAGFSPVHKPARRDGGNFWGSHQNFAGYKLECCKSP